MTLYYTLNHLILDLSRSYSRIQLSVANTNPHYQFQVPARPHDYWSLERALPPSILVRTLPNRQSHPVQTAWPNTPTTATTSHSPTPTPTPAVFNQPSAALTTDYLPNPLRDCCFISTLGGCSFPLSFPFYGATITTFDVTHRHCIPDDAFRRFDL